MNWNAVIEIVAAIISSLGFAILFNIRGRKLFAVAIGGGVGWLFFLLLENVIANQAIVYFVAAATVSLYAEVMARVLKSPATIFITPSLVPLVPGASLYYAMRHAFDGNSTQFLSRAVETLQFAAAIAIGVIVSAVVMKLVTKMLLTAKIRKEKRVGKGG